MVVGDLAARLWFSALLYLVNGTARPSEVADGFPLHKAEASDKCAWPPDKMRRGGYDFGGWAHFRKNDPCFLRWFGCAHAARRPTRPAKPCDEST